MKLLNSISQNSFVVGLTGRMAACTSTEVNSLEFEHTLSMLPRAWSGKTEAGVMRGGRAGGGGGLIRKCVGKSNLFFIRCWSGMSYIIPCSNFVPVAGSQKMKEYWSKVQGETSAAGDAMESTSNENSTVIQCTVWSQRFVKLFKLCSLLWNVTGSITLDNFISTCSF